MAFAVGRIAQNGRSQRHCAAPCSAPRALGATRCCTGVARVVVASACMFVRFCVSASGMWAAAVVATTRRSGAFGDDGGDGRECVGIAQRGAWVWVLAWACIEDAAGQREEGVGACAAPAPLAEPVGDLAPSPSEIDCSSAGGIGSLACA
eukprot:738104-Pleurochrysis_carterae.AAC.1